MNHSNCLYDEIYNRYLSIREHPNTLIIRLDQLKQDIRELFIVRPFANSISLLQKKERALRLVADLLESLDGLEDQLWFGVKEELHHNWRYCCQQIEEHPETQESKYKSMTHEQLIVALNDQAKVLKESSRRLNQSRLGRMFLAQSLSS